nr:efflux transporter outer membrane subunit [Novosphingobium terrae]
MGAFKKGQALLVLALAGTALAGCDMAPAYHPKAPDVPPHFAETPGWQAAEPMDALPRGKWWEGFNDPQLNALEDQAEKASPTLAAALARYDAATAAARVSAAALLPEVDAGASAERTRVSRDRPSTTGRSSTYDVYNVGASLSYEVDFWGRVRNNVKAARAEAQASAGDLSSARLSLQAEVADAYVRLRGLDAQAELLRHTVDAYQRAWQLNHDRHEGGDASGVDENRALSQLASAKAQVSAISVQRATAEHEIAAAVGEVASSFHLEPNAVALTMPQIPSGTPGQVIQRRPDIAAAERRMFEANAGIGAARAAQFPTVTLGGNAGWQATGGHNLLSAPDTVWAIGPLAASLPIFDAGKRRAQVRQARAQFDEAAASYRGAVIAAFQQVEDALATERDTTTQARDQTEAAQAASRTSDLAFIRYRDGATDYLEVVTAQTDALTAERSRIAVETQRRQAAIALVKAIGGAVPEGRQP